MQVWPQSKHQSLINVSLSSSLILLLINTKHVLLTFNLIVPFILIMLFVQTKLVLFEVANCAFTLVVGFLYSSYAIEIVSTGKFDFC